MKLDTERFIIKIAETSDELHAAQRLRYKVFVEEMGANARVLAENSFDDSLVVKNHYSYYNKILE